MHAKYKSFSHKHLETFSSYSIFFIRSAKGKFTPVAIKFKAFYVGYLTRNEKGKAFSFKNFKYKA